MEFGVSQVSLAVVQDLIGGLCGEFSLFRKIRVRVALEVLRKKLYFVPPKN